MVVSSISSRLAGFDRQQHDEGKLRHEDSKKQSFDQLVQNYSQATDDDLEALRRLSQLKFPSELGINFAELDRRGRNREQLSPLMIEKQQAYIRTVDNTNSSVNDAMIVADMYR